VVLGNNNIDRFVADFHGEKNEMIKYLFFILFFTLSGCAYYRNVDSPKPTDVLKYNYLEKEWAYTSQNSELRYNYLENRWEFSR